MPPPAMRVVTGSIAKCVATTGRFAATSSVLRSQILTAGASPRSPTARYRPVPEKATLWTGLFDELLRNLVCLFFRVLYTTTMVPAG